MDISSILIPEAVPGAIAPNLSRDRYRDLPRLNPSSLACGLLSATEVNPAAVKHAWERPESERSTGAIQDRLDRGTLAHLLVLQPELLMDRVAVWRGGQRRSGREDNPTEWDMFQHKNAGKLLIRDSDYTDVTSATSVMLRQPIVSDLLCNIQAEVAMLSTETFSFLDGYIGVKGQVDAVNIGKRRIVDLKTTEAGIDQRSVERTIRNLCYREKMALYRRWLARETKTEPTAWECWNLFMSLTEPYGVRAVKFTSDALEWGEIRMMTVMKTVAECLAENEWPMLCVSSFMGLANYELEDDDEMEVQFD